MQNNLAKKRVNCNQDVIRGGCRNEIILSSVKVHVLYYKLINVKKIIGTYIPYYLGYLV